MKENYDLLLKNIINNLQKKEKLLLHSCCAPCSSYVISYLKEYFDITILYYNPNISPIEEYEKRKNEQIRLLKELNIKYLDCEYDNSKYEEVVKGLENEPERGQRCTKCFNLRLEKTAKEAKSNDFEYFGTTLTVSPYKNCELINKIGSLLAEKYNLNWLFSDFKKNDGYKKSIILSNKYNLYRQDYCGCKYSKKESLEK